MVTSILEQLRLESIITGRMFKIQCFVIDLPSLNSVVFIFCTFLILKLISTITLSATFPVGHGFYYNIH